MCTFGRESLFRPREITEDIGHIGLEFERSIEDVTIIRVYDGCSGYFGY